MKSLLKSFRQKHKLKIREVAAALKVDAALISRFESGERLPTEAQMQQLAEFLKIPLGELNAEWLKEKILRQLNYSPYASEAMFLVQEALVEYKTRGTYLYSSRLETVLHDIDFLKEKLDRLRHLDNYRIAEALELEYTFESNRIEGNTLTLRETDLVVNEGLTISGKTMREHLEAINHRDAIDYVKDLVSSDTELTERELLTIHNLILRGIHPEDAGKYRDVNVMITGSAHMPPDSLVVPDKMRECFQWYREHQKTLHPVVLASEMHEKIVTIHPFIDGNGRTARLVMNLILLRNGYVIANIKGENASRLKYYDALEDLRKSGNSDNFNHYCAVIEKESLERYLSVISPNY